MIYLIPFISAFIGWFTNYIAIKMLFHPREPRSFLGIKFQGIFPKRQKQIAMKLGSIVANELLHFDEIAERIKDPRHLNDVMPFIEKHIDEFLHVKLKEKLPVISMFIGEGMLQKVKEGLIEEIELLLPQLIHQFTEKLSTNIDIEKIVVEKVSSFSSDKLEEILVSILSKEFRFVEVIGGVLGFIIGLFQVVLTLFS